MDKKPEQVSTLKYNLVKNALRVSVVGFVGGLGVLAVSGVLEKYGGPGLEGLTNQLQYAGMVGTVFGGYGSATLGMRFYSYDAPKQD